MGSAQGCGSGFRDTTSRGKVKIEQTSVMVSATVALVLAGAAPVPMGAQQSATSLVFEGVTVVDVEQGKLVPDQRVVITGNRIKAVGGVGSVEHPDGAQVVDARGKYLIPGLWDMHVHTKTPQTYMHLIPNGVTGIRDAFGLPLDTMLQWRRDILAGTRVGAPRQILSGSAIFDSGPSSCNWVIITCVTPADTTAARRLGDSLKASGVDMLKMYDLREKTYFAIAAVARRRGIPFGGHVGGIYGKPRPGTTIPSIFEASDSGASIVDHVNLGAGELKALCLEPQATVERCRQVAERFRQNGTWWVPTLMNHRNVPPGIERGEPRLGAVSDAVAARYSKIIDESGKIIPGATIQGNWLYNVMQVGRTDSLRLLSVVERVGLPILAGTDVREAGFSLHAELALYVAEGLTPLHALQAATLNPAKMLRSTDSLGTVAPGKLADLVLLDADPLADITNTTTIRAVVANGRYFDRAALDGLLAEAQANKP